MSINKSLSLFACKLVMLILSTYLLIYCVGMLFDKFSHWQDVQNPRERLLWDLKYDGSRIVLLGDSAFSSFYVNSPKDTIWSVLAELSNEKVFPGALNGAKLKDIVSSAQLISDRWPKDTIVFVDITPTRFIKSNADNDTNYRDFFSEKIPQSTCGNMVLSQIERLKLAIIDSLFLINSRNAIAVFLKQRLISRPYYMTGVFIDKKWDDPDNLALERFKIFLKNSDNIDYKGFESIKTIHEILKQKGLKAVFILTPLNSQLIKSYANNSSDQIIDKFNDLRSKLLKYINSNQIEYLDLTDNMNPDCFRDLVHTNSCGDKIISRNLSQWLYNYRTVSTVGKN